MDLVLEDKLRIGLITIHRRTEPATGPWLPSIGELRELVELVDACGYDSLWCGDHISFPMAILDPFLQLAQAALVSGRLTFGTSVYLLPLRHPVPVAKQVATLDHLSEGRFIFGVGVGGEFAREYEACGVPINERGARLGEAIPLLRKLWSGKPVTHAGRFYQAFNEVPLQPPARQAGGPPIWCGGRSDAALARAGHLADGWIAYVVTPEMYKSGLDKIATSAKLAGRAGLKFGTGHLLFTRLDDTYAKALDAATVALSHRYAMDFRKAAERYAALGSPQQIADRMRTFHAAGVRHITLDLVGPYEERNRQIERIAREVFPLLKDLR
jgi:probable F420-dependent oxidoreductase